MSQEALSLATGVHRNFIGGIERGERNPTVFVIAQLAAALDVAVSQLFVMAERGEGAGFQRRRRS